MPILNDTREGAVKGKMGLSSHAAIGLERAVIGAFGPGIEVAGRQFAHFSVIMQAFAAHPLAGAGIRAVALD